MEEDVYIIGTMNREQWQWWPEIKPFIEQALEHSRGEMSADDCMTRTGLGLGLMWMVYNVQTRTLVGAAYTENIDYGKKQSLRIVALGGKEFDNWSRKLDRMLCEYATAERLNFVELVGRHGWARKLKTMGYEPVYVVCLKELSNGKDSGNDKDDKHYDTTPLPVAVH